MDWIALLKLLILQMAGQSQVNDESTAVAIIPNDNSPLNGAIINSESMETKNSPGNDKSYASPTFPSYSCSMPYPPPTVDEKPIENTDHRPHNKVTMIIPLTVFHKLPDSTAQQLHRYEEYCEAKIHDVYFAIKDFNNFNYEKNQEIQYLSMSEKQKQVISEQSQQKKNEIVLAYDKMHKVCAHTERYRSKITLALNPYLKKSRDFYPQPMQTPKLWYDMHNLETIVLQLFVPKLDVRTFYDRNDNEIHMKITKDADIDRKMFIPLPKEYLRTSNLNANNTKDDSNNNETIDGASLIVEENHPKTAIQLLLPGKSTDQSTEIFEPATFSTEKDIQQIIAYYVFKYWEYCVQDSTRKVFFYTKKLTSLKTQSTDENEMKNMEDKLASALSELQSATFEMERYRVTPEIINLYNAENAVHKLLPKMKFVSKLIGENNKRAITVFSPSEFIESKAITSQSPTNSLDNVHLQNELVESDDRRENLDEPLEWDKNWTWDF